MDQEGEQIKAARDMSQLVVMKLPVLDSLLNVLVIGKDFGVHPVNAIQLYPEEHQTLNVEIVANVVMPLMNIAVMFNLSL